MTESERMSKRARRTKKTNGTPTKNTHPTHHNFPKTAYHPIEYHPPKPLVHPSARMADKWHTAAHVPITQMRTCHGQTATSSVASRLEVLRLDYHLTAAACHRPRRRRCRGGKVRCPLGGRIDRHHPSISAAAAAAATSKPQLPLSRRKVTRGTARTSLPVRETAAMASPTMRRHCRSRLGVTRRFDSCTNNGVVK